MKLLKHDKDGNVVEQKDSPEVAAQEADQSKRVLKKHLDGQKAGPVKAAAAAFVQQNVVDSSTSSRRIPLLHRAHSTLSRHHQHHQVSFLQRHQRSSSTGTSFLPAAARAVVVPVRYNHDRYVWSIGSGQMRGNFGSPQAVRLCCNKVKHDFLGGAAP